MRVRYQTNPKVALLGLALSLGLIYGAHEAKNVLAAQEAQVEIEVGGDVIKVDPVGTTLEPSLDQRTC